MGWIRRLRRSLSPTSETFDEEARFHLDERTAEFIRRGMSPDEARRAAEYRFGNMTVARDQTADADMFRWVDDVRRDLGYGLRMLRRSPGFALLAILCLTLGMGANAAVLSWIEGILLRPYPLVADQDRLYAVTATERGDNGQSRTCRGPTGSTCGAAARWSMRSLPKRSRGPRSASAIAPNARPEASSRRTTSTRSVCIR